MSKDRVHRYIDDHRDESLEILKTLIRQPSISAQDVGVKECARLLAGIMADLGITAEVIEPWHSLKFVFEGEEESGSRNLGSFVREHQSRLAAAGVELRSLNACALDLAFVASGRLEGYWDAHTSLWDVAAGILLIEEAGGHVTVRESGDAQGSGLMVLGSNRHLHDALCEVLGLG